MSGLTLYVDSNFCSPYAMSVYVTLLEKKLDFELKTIDLDHGQQNTPAYLDLAITGRVPTLVHGNWVLNESSAIIEYLDEAFPAPGHATVLPADIKQRARARQVQAWLRSDLLDLRNERNTGTVFIAPVTTPLTTAGQAAAERLIRVAERLIAGEHLFGAWSIADTDLAMMIQRLLMNGHPLPQRVAEYARRQWQRPNVQEWVQQVRAS
jgi:glutathione S-transferase